MQITNSAVFVKIFISQEWVLYSIWPRVHIGKLESGSPWKVWQFLRIIYKISGVQNVVMDMVRATERSGSLPHCPSHEKWRKACINICKHILKFSNCVLVRVSINNNNYKEPIALFVIILAKNTFTNHHGII